MALADTVDFGPQGLAIIANERSSAVIIDVGQTDLSTLCRTFKDASPSTKLIAFGLHETVENVVQCLRAGFSGYIRCESGPGELGRAIINAIADRLVMRVAIAAELVRKWVSPVPPPSLSPRENEVLAGLAKGWSNKRIARQLLITPLTVKRHTYNIFRKLGLKNRTEAAAMACSNHDNGV